MSMQLPVFFCQDTGNNLPCILLEIIDGLFSKKHPWKTPVKNDKKSPSCIIFPYYFLVSASMDILTLVGDSDRYAGTKITTNL